ncbi:cytochrome P450 CYP749A22-like [Gossypium arboreum]|uniref:cytochrome P450 CYP749A22-like n=1 Tax=Gossypium arboreum TaxID=29729 RepID=UPI000818F993|nr:cytochrome P450 CYP749A22-like [Gossypium arboreum]
MSGLMELVILVPCCFFIVALIKFLYDYLWIPLRIQHILNSQGIKGPPFRFIHGNNKEIAKMKQEALGKPVAWTDDLFPRLQPHIYSWINRYGKNFVYWDGARAELVISEPELVKEVLKNSENIFQKVKLPEISRKLMGNGLAFTEGEKWAKYRKLANHTFHGESLKNMTPAMIASVETMLEKWKGQEGQEIEVFQEFRLLTSEVISKTAFGSSYLEGEKIFALLYKLKILVSRNMSKTTIPFINKLWKSADLLESEKLAKGIQDCVMKIVKKREDQVVNGEADSFGNDFFGLLVNAYHDLDEKNRLSLEDLVDECKTFYIAGQETVNSLLAWIVLHLAIHGDWQEKTRREVIDIFGNQNPHLEGITKLKTMAMVINETLRLYGPSNGLARTVAREVQLGKLFLLAKLDILPLNIGVHRDPHLWGDDVHLFKPERFADGIAKATNYTAAAFLPFGLGPRSCVGMTFATIETKIVLSMILQRYTITLSPAYVHSPILILTVRPQHGIQLTIYTTR